MEGIKGQTIEELNRKRFQFLKDLQQHGKMNEEMIKLFDQVEKLSDGFFSVVKGKTCLINGKPGRKKLLAGGAVLVEFVDKKECERFFDE